ncbi:MAG TPA: UDP-3-O-(3-hydroxymyristoyl)glucosamine N-acyltransferase [Hydrogenophaga sp.]|uniref:UDP-3-O-(3-hydroxymyristoyl)glucosamine N-acyltransferase n=1 Tax=Hydrogenophaga sp. TaxID=1904254 RepID=UPI002D01286C|nr:UDP-3-O-(3-hydroxymyristoyl)glucosamine N-acyltransferase [Hydrogenophaga sp.]HMN91900.1 UDP-3-O-(3-hydroxymyristoyl)glucosamine N-acyltransferase [Hydrogenophaga sp.]HMP08960.1 UDP-3-O-(3-hydroxymyristoyl)glucosamine N-acyltransferase [Hydrogenophaga sp.]
MARSLGTIVGSLGGTLRGEAGLQVERLAPIGDAGPADLAFVAHVRYAAQIQTTRAGALIVAPALADAAALRGACIVADDPYFYFACLTQWWRDQHDPLPAPRVDPSAHIHPLAVLGEDVDIGPFAVVEEGAQIGPGARIGAHSVVQAQAQVGARSQIGPRVVIGRRCRLGARCIVHPGVVIGADGFGFAPRDGRWVKIEQLGSVRIGDDVEIGANTCIDRGALGDTVIEDGVKLDNLVQIGHNVNIGAHSALAGCVGVAGSATIGAGCTVGGGAGILGHLSLADGVHISSFSLVTRSIQQPGQYTGVFPIDDNAAWEKNAASLKQLNRLRERVKALEQAMATAQKTQKQP